MNRSGLSFILVAVLLCGCISAPKRVAEQLPAVQREWQTNVQHQAHLPEGKLDWPQAVERARVGNLKLRAAQAEVIQARDSVRQVYRDLRPTLSLRSGLSRRLGDIPSTGLSDVTFNADGFVNLPGIAGFTARKFAAELSLLRAEAAERLQERLQERTQGIEIYKVFQKAMQNRENREALLNRERMARQWQVLDPALGGQLLNELEAEQVSLALESGNVSEQLGDLIGDRSQRWSVETNGLPALDYATLPLGDTNRVGQLQLRLAAIELAGAKARLQGIKLQYWPELYIFVSGPPLYQRVSGTERFWDIQDVRASADFYWQLDTRGNVSRQLRQEKQSQELQGDRMRLESQGLIARLLAAQRLLATAREQEEKLARQRVFLGQLPPAADFQGWQQVFNLQRAVEKEQQKLRAQTAELQTLFWFLDDEAWK